MTSIHNIDKGDHLVADREYCYHHSIVAENYVKQGGRKNGKELQTIEFDGPQTSAKATIVASDKNLDELGHVHKIQHASGEAFNSGGLQRKHNSLIFTVLEMNSL